jgi:hypothetical protein
MFAASAKRSLIVPAFMEIALVLIPIGSRRRTDNLDPTSNALWHGHICNLVLSKLGQQGLWISVDERKWLLANLLKT